MCIRKLWERVTDWFRRSSSTAHSTTASEATKQPYTGKPVYDPQAAEREISLPKELQERDKNRRG
jgi:hypothetical protein